MKNWKGIGICFVIIVSAGLILWLWRLPWPGYLWANISYMLHQEWFVVPLIAVLYIVSVLIARWHLVARPIRLDVLAQIEDVKLQLQMEAPGDAERQRKIHALGQILNRAEEILKNIDFLDRVFWSRGQEVASWELVDAVQRQLATIQPIAKVKVRLEAAESELRAFTGDKQAAALADRIHAESASKHPDDHRLRCFLDEALDTTLSAETADVDDTLNWHNKVVWLAGVGILLLISLEGVRRGGGGLLAVGAIGGFLGRLMRTMQRKDQGTSDYDAYWTTFFLSPMVGALTGWTGILLIELAFRLNVLGTVFGEVSLDNGYRNLTMGLAFLFGFSERLFDKILRPIEAKIAKDSDDNDTGSGKSPHSNTGNGASPGANSSLQQGEGSDTGSDSSDSGS